MGNLAKKIRDENDKKVLKEMFGREPKHRCPVCHRFSLWVPSKNGKESECVMCELIRRTREERKDANEQIGDIRPEDIGE